MAYLFTPDLATGNTLIDEQHKKLFAAINALMTACSTGQGRAELAKTTKFLYDYTSTHFSDEEKLQMQYRYPDYVNHHRSHEEFKKVVADFSKQLEAQGPTIALVAQVNTAIGGWLNTHIKSQDTKVAAHIRAAGK